ncbi:MAG: InlB B-repeat-containing protein [Chitinispirillia bacterium]|nr:InlB B-repeat-containing protein [Chitinispirillia bacterium]
MKKTLFTAVLFFMMFAGIASAQTSGTGWLSRYWDGCKLHCNWTGNTRTTAGNVGVAGVCNRQNESVTPSDQVQSACNNASGQYVCWDHAPVAISETLSYAFVAVNPAGVQCGQCFEMEFTGQGAAAGTKGPAPTGATHRALVGKRMIVMVTNIGGDVENSPQKQFDVLIPGGGVGIHNAISGQLGHANNNLLGAQYGGFLTRPCNSSNVLATAQSCLREQCENLSNAPLLREGCLWHANWMMAANNPEVRWSVTTCPQELIDWYKDPKKRPAGSGGGTDPVTYTITFNAGTGGSVTPATATTAANGTLSALPVPARSGHTFSGWFTEAAGGTQVTTSTVFTANAAIFARWTPIGGGGEGDTTGGCGYLPAWCNDLYATSDLVPAKAPDDGSACFFVTEITEFCSNANASKINGVDVGQGHLGCWGNNGTLPEKKDGGYYVWVDGGVGSWQGTAGAGPSCAPIVVSVKHTAAKRSAHTAHVTVTAGVRGFRALLHSDHTFHSYSLVDLQGREIRKGKVQSGASELYFNDVRQGVLFLRLKGKNGTTVLRATTF